MAEKCPKSKLKRKKLSIEEPRTDIFFRNTLIKNNESSNASIESLSSTRPVVPTEAWWSRGDLAAIESLWALTLSSALPCLEAHPWDPVPDLPTASTLSSTVDQQSEWRWCSLSEDMTPFPSSPSPPPMAPHCSTTDSPLNPSPGLENTLLPVPVQTRQTTSTISGPPLKSAPCQEGPGEGTSSSGAGHPRPPSLGARVPASYGRGGPWSGGGHSMVSSRKDTKRGEGGQNTGAARPHPTARRPGGEKESHPSIPQPSIIRAGNGGSSLPPEARKGGGGVGEEGEKRGMKRLQLPANRGEASSSTSDSCTAAPMEEEGEKREEGVSRKGRADGDAGKGGGGWAMQSCPMCLVPFPAGFTQMDCDSHLAKCLSEMTVDMTW
ncbi:hypothetical protein J4Q44_G00256140 [Coregonus suidteri]|uniref:UBZ2-type domain-containing protein n=1 Tax=Coregonus suidteri TaxID=861788 RepID=A0AAN8LC46_9TELE